MESNKTPEYSNSFDYRPGYSGNRQLAKCWLPRGGRRGAAWGLGWDWKCCSPPDHAAAGARFLRFSRGPEDATLVLHAC